MNITVILNSWGYSWFSFMQNSLIESAVVLLIVSLIWLAIHKKVGSQLGYCLFLLVLFKLLVPLEISVPQEWRYASPRHAVGEAVNWAVVQVQREPIREPASPTISPIVESQPSQPPILLSNMPPASTTTKTIPENTMEKARIEPLTWKAGLMLLWAAIVSALLLRLLWIQSKTQRFLKNSTPVDDRLFPINWLALKRSAQINSSLPLLENPDVSSPLVWGILRPCIIVPQNFAALLSPAQIQWVLLHEIGHVRRWDLPATLFQRVIQILFFWNPALWIANRTIDRLREYACDDFALSITTASRKDCGEGLLNVVERAAMLPEPVTHALGLLDTKTHLIHRLRRILDPHRLVHRKLSLGAAVLLVIIAAVVLPIVRAEQNESGEVMEIKNVTTPSGPILSGTVTDQTTGKPIEKVAVKIAYPQKGSFNEDEPIWKATEFYTAQTDSNGRYTFESVPVEGRYRIMAQADGYITFYPRRIKTMDFVLLDEQHRGQTYDFSMQPGFAAVVKVVDQAGQPVTDAYMAMFVNNFYQEKPQLWSDDEGIGFFNTLPKEVCRVQIFKKGYGPAVSGDFMPGIPDQPAQVTVILKAPSSISGTVTAEDGSPAAHAPIRTYSQYNTDLLNTPEIPPFTTTTDDQGHYTLTELGEGEYSVMTGKYDNFEAGGYGMMQQVKVTLQPGERKENVDFKVRRYDLSHTAQGRVVDTEGHPVAGASIEMLANDSWTHQSFGRTDQDGDFVISNLDKWSEAEFKVRMRGFLECSESHKADEPSITLTLQKAGVLQGRVHDQEGNSIANAIVYGKGQERHSWVSTDNGGGAITNTGYDGSYRLESLNKGIFRFVVEMPGYEKAVVDDVEIIPGETKTLDIQISQGVTVTGTVVNAEGSPVADAEIGLRSKAVTEENMILLGAPSHLTDTVKADAEGKFTLTGIGSKGDEIIVQHPNYAPARFPHKPTSDSTPITIALTPGGSIEGTVNDIDGNPKANIGISIFNFPENLFTYEVKTDTKGHYRIDHLHPTEYMIRKYWHTSENENRATPGNEQVNVNVVEGKTLNVSFGFGVGPRIVGTILDEGQPVPGVDITLQKGYQSLHANEQTVTTDENGQFIFKAVPPGEWIATYSLKQKIQSPVVRGSIDNYTKITVPQGKEDVEMTLNANAYPLFVVLTDLETGKPIPEANLSTMPDRENDFPYPLHIGGRTKNDGVAFMMAKEPMDYTLVASKDGYTTTFFPVTIPALKTGEFVTCVTKEIQMPPCRTQINVHLYQENKPWSEKYGGINIIKEGKHYPVQTVPVEGKPGEYRISGAPEGLVTIMAHGSKEGKNYEMIGFISTPQTLLVKNDEPVTLVLNLQKEEHYQIRFQMENLKYYQEKVTFEIPDYPDFNTLYKNVPTKPWGAHLSLPEGQFPVRALVPGYKPIEFNPGKLRSGGAEVIELKLEKE